MQSANSLISDLLVRLRSEVQQHGGTTVDAAAVATLCSEELTLSEHFKCIAAIAKTEGWSFAFQQNGAVRFGSYS